MGGHGLELRPEQEAPTVPAVIQRLLPQAVARQDETALLPIPEREGEHAIQFRQGRRDSMPAQQGKQNLGVRMAAPGIAVADPTFQVQIVVDLAVEGEDEAPAGGEHRLMTQRGQVENGKSSVPKGNPLLLVEPNPTVIRPTVNQGIRHGLDRIDRRLAIRRVRTAYPTDSAPPIQVRTRLQEPAKTTHLAVSRNLFVFSRWFFVISFSSACLNSTTKN